jgi:hypothetical protein
VSCAVLELAYERLVGKATSELCFCGLPVHTLDMYVPA